jgi:hypothetical protein
MVIAAQVEIAKRAPAGVRRIDPGATVRNPTVDNGDPETLHRINADFAAVPSRSW